VLTRIMSVAAAAAIWPAIASGQTIDSGDTAWMLTSTALVLFMTLPGLALFYAGLVQRRNALSVLMQCFAIACVMSILWVVCGYSLAFGESSMGGLIGSFSVAWLSGITFDTLSSVLPNIPESVFVMFQMTFAIITPALIVGAFAERMRFSAMLLFTSLWLLVVYAPVAHWIWGGGWLSEMGFRDFAGRRCRSRHGRIRCARCRAGHGESTRVSRYAHAAAQPDDVGHRACMLWVGWFGFNAGSAGAANGSAGMAMLVTHLSAACAALTWMGAEWVKFGKPSVLGIVTGMVAGLATITPASGFVGPIGGLIIGVAAGGGCFVATQFMKRVLKIDDSLDVFPVHGVGGIIGLLLTAVFSAAAVGGVGLDEGGIGGQFMTQVIGIVATLAWCGGATFVLLKVIDMIVPLRVSADEETEGLDLVLHEESGYNL